MDTISPNSLGQGGFQPSDSLATAPPPPAEVKIRTMRSDLESMAKSGGGLPRFQNVKVSGLGGSGEKQGPSGAAKAHNRASLIPIIITLVTIAVLAVAGWFVYTHVFANTAGTPSVQPPITPSSTQSNPVTVPTTTPSAPPPAALIPFTHASLLKIPADQILLISFSGGAVQNASDLQSYNQKMLALTATAKKTATFLEIDAKDAAGHDASINELLAAANASVIDPLALTADFNPDATFFVYHDKNGFWPGYIISLASGKNWLFTQNDISKIESSPNIPNLFLMNVGSASPDGFTDSVIASSSVRVLPFFGASAPAYFTYGWTPDHQYLILSTSQNGFIQAVKRL